MKWQTVPCTVIDAATPVDKLREYTIKDNADYGKWDFDLLANQWDAGELKDWGIDIPQIDFDDPKDEAEGAQRWQLKIDFANGSDYSRALLALTDLDDNLATAILKLIDK